MYKTPKIIAQMKLNTDVDAKHINISMLSSEAAGRLFHPTFKNTFESILGVTASIDQFLVRATVKNCPQKIINTSIPGRSMFQAVKKERLTIVPIPNYYAVLADAIWCRMDTLKGKPKSVAWKTMATFTGSWMSYYTKKITGRGIFLHYKEDILVHDTKHSNYIAILTLINRVVNKAAVKHGNYTCDKFYRECDIEMYKLILSLKTSPGHIYDKVLGLPDEVVAVKEPTLEEYIALLDVERPNPGVKDSEVRPTETDLTVVKPNTGDTENADKLKNVNLDYELSKELSGTSRMNEDYLIPEEELV